MAHLIRLKKAEDVIHEGNKSIATIHELGYFQVAIPHSLLLLLEDLHNTFMSSLGLTAQETGKGTILKLEGLLAVGNLFYIRTSFPLSLDLELIELLNSGHSVFLGIHSFKFGRLLHGQDHRGGAGPIHKVHDVAFFIPVGFAILDLLDQLSFTLVYKLDLVLFWCLLDNDRRSSTLASASSTLSHGSRRCSSRPAS